LSGAPMAQGPQGQWNAERPWPVAGTGASGPAGWGAKSEMETEAPTLTEDMEHVDLESKVWTGSVKSFNQDKGWGHIECAETFKYFSKDIFLLKSQLPGPTSNIGKGTRVNFRISDNGRGPEATSVEVLSPPGAIQSHGPFAGAGGPNNGGLYSGSYVGVVKSFNTAAGWGHIACAETEQMYGKDIFVMKSKIPGGSISKGTVVQFAVVDGQKGPEADAVKLVPGIVGAVQPGWSKTPQAKIAAEFALPLAWAAPMQPPPPQMIQHMHSGGGGGPPSYNQGQSLHYGTVKSFNEEKGWGHITCPQTQSMYGKDMFVMRSALIGGPINPGDHVAFGVRMGLKGPEAINVEVLGLEGAEAIYEGIIKQFAEDKGWGFISCEETHQLHNKDIFIHRNELNGYVPAQGEAVQFAVQISNLGRPEATRINFGPSRYAAVRGAYPQAARGGRVAPF